MVSSDCIGVITRYGHDIGNEQCLVKVVTLFLNYMPYFRGLKIESYALLLDLGFSETLMD